jgi:two-component system CheB/CheR fusion protein
MTNAVLIVEDDPDGQALVAHVVGHLKFSHTVVDNGDDALAALLAAGAAYRAVIIDLALPGKDGWQLVADIRNTPATADLICIAVTGFHSAKTREDALRAGFNAYFSKPLEATHFARELESLL